MLFGVERACPFTQRKYTEKVFTTHYQYTEKVFTTHYQYKTHFYKKSVATRG